MTHACTSTLLAEAALLPERDGLSLQVGLVDMLREEYGVVPAGMLGHSAGEIAAGYADGCQTREQTVLIAYWRGRMAPDHGVSGGLMAAVGLSAGAPLPSGTGLQP